MKLTNIFRVGRNTTVILGIMYLGILLHSAEHLYSFWNTIPDVSDPEQHVQGTKGTSSFRIFYEKNGKRISPWHNIPLYSDKCIYTCHFVCEIPKWTRDKMEIQTQLKHNPIAQDMENNQVRQYHYGDMMFNYGALPQTWEDPYHIWEETHARGDDDPVDVIEIGCQQMKLGSIHEVKILGVLGLIDEGETDWKIITISVQDYLAPQLQDIDDVYQCLPGLLEALREWLQKYKTTNGGEENRFAFQGEYQNRNFALHIIQKTHYFWHLKFRK